MLPLLLAQAAASPILGPVAEEPPTTLGGWILRALVGLLGLVVSLAGGAFAKWLLSKASTSSSFGVMAKAFEVAMSVVAHIDAKVRPELLADLSDGKLDAGERKALQDAALKAFKEALGPDGVADIKKALGLGDGAVDVILGGLLERALTALRGQQAAADAGLQANPSPAAVAAAVARTRP